MSAYFAQLNVRISVEAARELDELMRRTGRTKRDLTEDAIHALYAKRVEKTTKTEVER